MFPIVVLGGTLVNSLSTRDLQLFATSASVHNIPYNDRLSVSITRFRGTSYWFVMLRHDRIRQATAVAPVVQLVGVSHVAALHEITKVSRRVDEQGGKFTS